MVAQKCGIVMRSAKISFFFCFRSLLCIILANFGEKLSKLNFPVRFQDKAVASILNRTLIDVPATTVVILSATPHQRFVGTLPTAISGWLALGFRVHVVVVVPHKANSSLLHELLEIVSSDVFISYETTKASAFVSRSLPGLVRYIAASSPAFHNTTVILSDTDMVPLGKARDYFARRMKAANLDRVNVDTTYPLTHKMTSMGLNKSPMTAHAPMTKSKLFEYYRQPRFRTCYLLGRGQAFWRVFSPLLPLKDSAAAQLAQAACGCKCACVAGHMAFYTPNVIMHAYSSPFRPNATKDAHETVLKAQLHFLTSGPDGSFDEILFGKLLTLKHRKHLERNESVDMMLGESQGIWKGKGKLNSVRASALPAFVDVHLASRRSRGELDHMLKLLKTHANT